MSKKVIAVDIDDVQASGALGFVEYSNKRWGTNLKVEDYTEHWAELWQVDKEEANIRANDIYNSRIHVEFKYLKDAQPVMLELSKKYKLVIVTSRHRLVQETTLEWLRLHFKGIFEEIHFAGIWDAGHDVSYALNLTKAEISKQIGADFLIDDQPKHCFAAAKAGIKALLFGDYRWNRDIRLPKGVTRVRNWVEVKEYFSEESK